MSESRDQKLKDLIRETAADFMQRQSNYTSLITITDVSVSDRGKRATIFFTVLPDDKEKGALDFAKRKRAEYREYFTETAGQRLFLFYRQFLPQSFFPERHTAVVSPATCIGTAFR